MLTFQSAFHHSVFFLELRSFAIRCTSTEDDGYAEGVVADRISFEKRMLVEILINAAAHTKGILLDVVAEAAWR
jgi:hypothetical protein